MKKEHFTQGEKPTARYRAGGDRQSSGAGPSQHAAQSMLERVSDAVLLLDVDGRIAFANAAAWQLLSTSAARHIGSNFRDIFPETERDAIVEAFRRVRDLGESYSFDAAMPGGTMLHFRAYAEGDGISLILHRKGETDFLAQNLPMLAHTVQSIAECVSITDANDTILYVNDAFLRTYKYSAEQLIGRNIAMVRSPRNDPAQLRGILPDTLTGGWEGQIWNRRADGSDFPISLSTSQIHDNDGRLLALVGVAKDVTSSVEQLDTLTTRLHVEALLADFSTTFLNLPTDRLDAELARWLRRWTEVLDVDRSILFELQDSQILRIRSSYSAPPLPAMPVMQADVEWPWFVGQVRRGVMLRLASIDDLPLDAVSERDYMKETGLKSHLTIPMIGDGKLMGALSFGCFREERAWSEALIPRLRVIGEIFAGALLRSQSERTMQENAENMSALLTATDNLIFLIDTGGHILSVNDRGAANLGGTREELIGRSLDDFFSPYVTRIRAEFTSRAVQRRAPVTFEDERNGHFYESTVFPIAAEHNGVVRILLIVRDITDRILADRSLAREAAMNADLASLSQRIMQIDSVDDIARTTLDRAMALTGATKGMITYRSPQDDAFVCHSSESTIGFDESRIQSDMVIETLRGAIDHVTTQRKPVIANDAASRLPFTRHLPLSKQETNFLVYPAVYGDTLVGHIAVAVESNGFAQHAVVALERIALLYALAIQREQADCAVRDSELRMHLLADATFEGIAILDDDRIMEANEQLAAMLGREAQELLGSSLGDIIAFPSGDGDAASVLPGAWALRKDGSQFPVDIQTRALPYHGKEMRIIAVRDITGRRAAEDAIMASEERWRSLAMSAPNIIITADCSGTVQFVNRAFSRLLPEDLDGRHVATVACPAHAALLEEQVAAAIATNTIASCDITGFDDRWYLVRINPIRRSDGISGVVLIFTDLTEHKRTEQDLIVARERAEQSERLKDSFIANISHEIRTPLNTIMGYSSFIESELADRLLPEEKEWFSSIDRSGKRLTRTIEHILNISSIETGSYHVRRVPVDLVQCVEKIAVDLQPIAVRKGLHFEFTTSCRNAVILGDAYSIDQALINLIDNAVKFTEQGGIFLRLSTDGSAFRIDVEDTGIGIAEEYLPCLYSTFSQEAIGFTRPYQGLGLGLALVKRYVELNGGTIAVRSQKGIGTCFSVTFIDPARTAPGADRRIGTPAAAEHAPVPRPSLLIVEDDPETRKLLSVLLSRSYALRTADNAADALEMLAAEAADMIIMDMSIEGDMDGLALTRHLRTKTEWKDLPVIAVTAHAFPEDRRKCTEAGCTDYLAKPFRREQLLATIQLHLIRQMQE